MSDSATYHMRVIQAANENESQDEAPLRLRNTALCRGLRVTSSLSTPADHTHDGPGSFCRFSYKPPAVRLFGHHYQSSASQEIFFSRLRGLVVLTSYLLRKSIAVLGGVLLIRADNNYDVA
jgi:hypothetical protein